MAAACGSAPMNLLGWKSVSASNSCATGNCWWSLARARVRRPSSSIHSTTRRSSAWAGGCSPSRCHATLRSCGSLCCRTPTAPKGGCGPSASIPAAGKAAPPRSTRSPLCPAGAVFSRKRYSPATGSTSTRNTAAAGASAAGGSAGSDSRFRRREPCFVSAPAPCSGAVIHGFGSWHRRRAGPKRSCWPCPSALRATAGPTTGWTSPPGPG